MQPIWLAQISKGPADMAHIDKSRPSDPLPRLVLIAASAQGRKRLRGELKDPGISPAYRAAIEKALAM